MNLPASIKIGLAQMFVEGGNAEGNLGRAEGMIHEASAEGCEIVILPECMDIGWTWPEARSLADTIPGVRTDQLARAAQGAAIHVAAGLTERAGDRIYNSAVLISPDGEILLRHRKINILSIAQDLYSIGDSLGVAETKLGVVGMDICADNFSSCLALGHSLARMGAHCIVSPSAWAVDADHDQAKDPYGSGWKTAYAKLARLYQIAIIGVSNVGWIADGPWKGKKCIGCSLAVGPDGDVLFEAPYGHDAEGLYTVEVPIVPRPAMGTDWRMHLEKSGFEGF